MKEKLLRTCGQRLAFTMAEILLSLTIIGVVAAITLPSLTGNINERTLNTQRKALYSRISQAVSLMSALNGYGTTSDNATETFITSGLSKVLKINNICDNDHIQECGIVNSYTNLAASKNTMPTTLYDLNSWFETVSFAGKSYSTKNTKAAAFETQNGESIVAFYNQTCRAEYLEAGIFKNDDNFGFPESTMCLNFIYDLNGKKGPNTIGKDMGVISVFNATDSVVVSPIPSDSSTSVLRIWSQASKYCTEQNSESRLPNIYELYSLFINKDLFNITLIDTWSSTVHTTERAWAMHGEGQRDSDMKNSSRYVRCVKR